MSKIKQLLKKFRKKVPVYVPVLQSNLLQGHSALITGGSCGIGYAIAEAFVASGCNVFITGRRQELLDTALKNLKSVNPDLIVEGGVL